MANLVFSSDQGYWPELLRDLLDNGAITSALNTTTTKVVIEWNGFKLTLAGGGFQATGPRQLTAGTIGSFTFSGPEGVIFKLDGFNDKPAASDFQQILTHLDGSFNEATYVALVYNGILKEALNVTGHDGFDVLIGTRFADVFDGRGDNDFIDYQFEGGPNGVTLNFQTGQFTDSYGNIDLVTNVNEAGGSRGNDTFISSGTADYHFWVGKDGADRYEGSANIWETVSYRFDGGTKGVVANLKTGKGTDTFGKAETYINIDELEGGVGADRLTGNDNDNAFAGNAGADVINGGLGRDRVYYHWEDDADGVGGVIVNLSAVSVTANVGNGNKTVAAGKALDSFGATDTLISIEDVTGTDYDDAIYGSAADNHVLGRKGNDLIRGGDGDDSLIGGDGNDTLYGDNGHDYFNSGTGADKLYGGIGDDFFDLDQGAQTVDGGADWDKVSYAEETGGRGLRVNMATGKITDTYGTIDTLTNVEGVKGSRYADIFSGSTGSDYFEGLAGADTFKGGAGRDKVDYRYEDDFGGARGVIINLSAAAVTGNIGFGSTTVAALRGLDAFGTTDVFSSIEDVSGTNKKDLIYGSADDNELEGFNGDDTLYGGDGEDILRGSSGNDKLYGQGDDDKIKGGVGDDRIDGGDGSDLVLYGLETPASTDTSGQHGVIVNLSTASITANVGQGTLTVGAGRGIDATGGTDILVSIEKVYGTEFVDYIVGSSVRNELEGNAGNDTIIAGAGDDWIFGGVGRDVMSGGTGGDEFFFESIADFGKTASTRDIIKDWDATDYINLRKVDANSTLADDQNFTFKTAQATTFSGAKGELIWSQINLSGTADDRTLIQGDTNGDKIADFQIELVGLIALNASDFVL